MTSPHRVYIVSLIGNSHGIVYSYYCTYDILRTTSFIPHGQSHPSRYSLIVYTLSQRSNQTQSRAERERECVCCSRVDRDDISVAHRCPRKKGQMCVCDSDFSTAYRIFLAKKQNKKRCETIPKRKFLFRTWRSESLSSISCKCAGNCAPLLF